MASVYTFSRRTPSLASTSSYPLPHARREALQSSSSVGVLLLLLLLCRAD